MEFSILGPLQVSDDGEPVPVRGQVLRRLLGVLLLDDGRICDVARLGAAMWDAEPAGVLDMQVRGLVGRLRETIGDVGHRVVESVGDGYRITSGSRTLDILRFDATLARAREHRSNGEHVHAEAAFTEALALWRGPILHGVRGKLIAELAAPWEAKRLSAIAERDALRQATQA